MILSCQPLGLSQNISTQKHKKSIQQLPAGWESQDSGTTQNLWGISFSNASTGSICGSEATILKTEDAGDNWNPQSCGVTSDLYALSFYDTSIGMTVGTEGSILTTSNGGTTWSTYQTGWLITYYGGHMITSSIGYAVGVNTINQPFVTWTTNGWSSHNDVAFYFEQGSTLYEGQLLDICSIDETTSYAAGRVWNGEGAIVQTVNGGSTWSTIYWNSDAFYCVDFPSVNVGYAAGANGNIVKTSDGGSTWTPLNSGVTTTLNGISFSTDDIGTAVCDNGVILRTENGGTTWIAQQSGVSSILTSIDFLDNLNGFIAGESGVILHTTTGGWDNLPPNKPETPEGPDEGISEKDYTFISSATDPEDDDISYKWDWGDGNQSTWSSLQPSGSTVENQYSWVYAGEFPVRVKGRDINGAEGDWSEPHYITIIDAPVLDIGPLTSGLFKLSTLIKNKGELNAVNVSWSIIFNGGFILLGKETTGTITSISPGCSKEISTDLVLGFGRTNIIVTVEIADGNTYSRNQDGTVLLFFIKVNRGGG